MDHEKIRSLREGMGLSQEQAAKLAGMRNRYRWSEIERGRYKSMNVATLEAIARALNCKPGDLLK